jgi:hypothetical protein
LHVEIFQSECNSDLQASTLSAPIVAARSGFGAGAIGGSFKRAIHEEGQSNTQLLIDAVSDFRRRYL